MASGVRLNPEELEQFISALQNFNRQTEELMKDMNAKFDRLGDTWQDAAYQRFGDDYMLTMARLQQFIDESDAHLPRLRERAARARELLELR